MPYGEIFEDEGMIVMDEFNTIVKIVREAMPLVQSGIPAIVGGFITAMFMRGNTNRAEFEKIKAGKVKEAVDALVDSRELTLTELVKCKNLLKIAEIADKEYSKQTGGKREFSDNQEPYDFDWFLRYFESAGNVSNEDMQQIWAKLLAKEVECVGRFSIRTINTLANMSPFEANLFRQFSFAILEFSYAVFMVPGLIEAYCVPPGHEFSNSLIEPLYDCGLTAQEPIKHHSTITPSTHNCICLQIVNKAGSCIIDNIGEINIDIEYYLIALTQSGRELYRLISDEALWPTMIPSISVQPVEIDCTFSERKTEPIEIVKSAARIIKKNNNNPNLVLRLVTKKASLNGIFECGEVFE